MHVIIMQAYANVGTTYNNKPKPFSSFGASSNTTTAPVAPAQFNTTAVASKLVMT